jgi:hypothetical protein
MHIVLMPLNQEFDTGKGLDWWVWRIKTGITI